MANEELVIKIAGNTKDAEAAFKRLGDLLDKAGKQSEDASKKNVGFLDSVKNAFSFGILTEINQGIELAKKFSSAIGDAAKSVFTLVAAGEDIKAINAQFELMTRNAGIATETLRGGLERAAGGIVDTEVLLQSASGAIVGLGQRAQQLPQIFELAKKSASVFGGDVIQTFEALSAAIQNGNTRALKNQGIVIDVDRVYKDYAKTLGLLATELTTAEKQQALLNAVLAKGDEAFANVDVNIRKTEKATKALAVSFGELGDTTAEFFARAFGGGSSTLLKTLDAGLIEFNQTLRKVFLDDAPQASEEISVLEKRLALLNQRLADNQKTGFAAFFSKTDDPTGEIRALQEQIALLEKKQSLEAGGSGAGPLNLDPAAVRTAYRQSTEAQIAEAKVQDSEAAARNERLLQEQTAFQAELQAIKDAAALEDENRQLQLDDADLFTQEDTLAKMQEFERRKLELQYEGQRQKLQAMEDGRKKEQALLILDANQAKAYAELKTKQDLEQQRQRQQNFRDSLGVISTLQSSGIKELFFVGKAAAIATATIDGIAATQKALASAPPPFNFVLAGLVGTASALNIAKIASTPPPTGFAEGGMVTGGIPGVDSVPIMAQPGELVTPARNFDEVVEATARSRGFSKTGDAGYSVDLLTEIRDTIAAQRPTIVVQGDVLTDELVVNRLAERLRDAVDFRNAKLG